MKKRTLLTLVLLCTILSTSKAQTILFSDNFSDGDISDWTQYDADGDGNIWNVEDISSIFPEFGNSITSSSDGLNPDNYIVSAPINLSGASSTNLVLEFSYNTLGLPINCDDTYSVYITTANDLATLQAATAVYTETIAFTGEKQTISVDLSSYSNQTIYVTFRHYNSQNKFKLLLDDVLVRALLTEDVILDSVSANKFSLPSTDNTLSMTITNDGSNSISSVEANWNDGSSDNIATINTNIGTGETVTINHPSLINYSGVVDKNITVTITAVNGIADSNTSNNVQNIRFNTLSQSGTRALLIEEGTGTWCGWCPRGAVGLDYITTTYPNTTVSIAVHCGNDPMKIPEYETSIASFILGYPEATINRVTNTDPSISNLQVAYNNYINTITPADLDFSSTISGNDLTITAEATFYSDFSANNFLRLGLIMIENGVTGTDSSYNQANNYAGGSSGAMGGYENLPNPVPASQMVYDHVARALVGGFDGQVNSVPTTMSNGQTIQYDFNYTIPETSDPDNMYIALVLIDSRDRSILNATQKSINSSLSTLDSKLASEVKIYPNPASDTFQIALKASNENYNITVTDMLGRTVLTKKHSPLSNAKTIAVSTHQLNAGQYIVTIATPTASYSKRLVINK
ncbi:MAG: Omp28-related outer membrane protein [Flavobacteriaceae bacterium]|nr:Omp28-related outer membrane protein [Flavobacteriaceae bacterium]